MENVAKALYTSARHQDYLSELPACMGPNGALMLVNRLQTSLDPSVLLGMFIQEMDPAAEICGASFTNRDGDVFETGRKSFYCASLDLFLENGDIGHLRIYTDSIIRENTRKDLTLASAFLRYPLQNALAYRSALYHSVHDALTGLRNRNGFLEDVKQEIERARRLGTPLSLLALDLDHFKEINDQHGHSTGDQALIRVAQCIKESVRSSDHLFRYGGDEFVIVLPDTSPKGVKIVANRVRLCVREHCIHDVGVPFTVSVGIGEWSDNMDAKALFASADDALYRAKRAGRNCSMV